VGDNFNGCFTWGNAWRGRDLGNCVHSKECPTDLNMDAKVLNKLAHVKKKGVSYDKGLLEK